MPNSNPHPSVFISYARKDGRQLARQLRASLEELGYMVFLDEESILGGDDWMQRIEEGLINATHFIAIVTHGSINSDFCQKEWRRALQMNIRTVPVMAEEDGVVPGFMGGLQYINFHSTDYDTAFDRLLKSIQAETSSHARRAQDWLHTPIHKYAVHHSRQTTVACISASAPISQARFDLDLVNYRYRHFLVTENGRVGEKLLGVLGLRQILKWETNPNSNIDSDPVSLIMDAFHPHAEPYSTFAYLNENDTLETALKVFTSRLTKNYAVNHFFFMSAIPLIDKSGGAVGIISFKDILKYMLSGEIPIPRGRVGDFMRNFGNISAGLPNHTVPIAKVGLRRFGQRDVPVVDNVQDRHLLGLVPDHVFISNYHTGATLDKIMVSTAHLKLQTEATLIEDMLHQYYDESKVYFGFPVTNHNTPANSPKLVGIIGYRDIFGALLET